MGINSQTPQTLDKVEGEAPTLNNGDHVTYSCETKEGEGQSALENVKNSMIDGERGEAISIKDKDGYDLGASCSNQGNENSKDSEGRRPKRK